jgi:hypothetical protein
MFPVFSSFPEDEGRTGKFFFGKTLSVCQTHFKAPEAVLFASCNPDRYYPKKIKLRLTKIFEIPELLNAVCAAL